MTILIAGVGLLIVFWIASRCEVRFTCGASFRPLPFGAPQPIAHGVDYKAAGPC